MPSFEDAALRAYFISVKYFIFISLLHYNISKCSNSQSTFRGLLLSPRKERQTDFDKNASKKYWNSIYELMATPPFTDIKETDNVLSLTPFTMGLLGNFTI